MRAISHKFRLSTATLLAMVGEVRGHVAAGNWLLAVTAGMILVLDLWVLAEGMAALYGRQPEPEADRAGAA